MNTDVVGILKLVWPLIIVEFGLLIWALVDVTKRGKTKSLNLVAWILIIIFINIFGPIAYFLFGRSEE